jgi:hypothetical protein
MIIITNHLLDLQAEADANRLAKVAKSARGQSRGRIASLASSLRSLLPGTADVPLALPKLADYPYRS